MTKTKKQEMTKTKSEVKSKVKKPEGFNFNKAFQTDAKKELDGAWTTLSMGGDSMKIMLARKDNNRASSYFRTLLRANDAALKPDDEKANELFLALKRKAIARCIVLDWDELLVDGKETPYSEAICERLLEFPDFLHAVEMVSSDFSIFRAEEDCKILGN
jgi:hypothetical protein